MMLCLSSTNPNQTEALGERLGTLLEPGDIVLLTGDLGAGKTQLTKGIARALGVTEPITSPTFNIVLDHQGAAGMILRHFDLYRLEREKELADIDYFGLLEEDAVSVVEWGDRFPNALPTDYLLLQFTWIDETQRVLCCSAEGSRSTMLLEQFEALEGSETSSGLEALGELEVLEGGECSAIGNGGSHGA